jgi:hypothetical protein
MRNKELFERKFETFESEVKLVGYHVRRNENDIAFEKVVEILEKIEDMRTLLNTESQD